MSEVVELHKDTHKPKNNLKQIQALRSNQLQIATNFKVASNHKTNCKPICNEKNLASNYNEI